MQRKYWEIEYRRRGRLWRGTNRVLQEYSSYLLEGWTLDAGCGNGKDTPPIKNIVGLDFSINALRLYPRDLKVQGDLLSIPFKSSSFSNVLFMHSLDHLLSEERNIALSEAYRVLKNNGIAIIKSFTVNDFRFGKGKEIEKNTFVRGNKIHTHYFSQEEFENMPTFKIREKKIINYNIIINKKYIKREEIIIIFEK